MMAQMAASMDCRVCFIGDVPDRVQQGSGQTAPGSGVFMAIRCDPRNRCLQSVIAPEQFPVRGDKGRGAEHAFLACVIDTFAECLFDCRFGGP